MTRLTSTRLAGLACALLVLVPVAGCTDDNPAPQPMPTKSPGTGSSSTSAEETPAPPVMPELAKGTSKAAAKAFAQHFFHLVNYAIRSGDAGPMRAVSASSCRSCHAIAQNVSGVANAGGKVVNGGWIIQLITPVPGGTAEVRAFDLAVHIQRERIEYPGGDVESNPGSRQPMTIELTRRASAWLVQDLDLVSS